MPSPTVRSYVSSPGPRQDKLLGTVCKQMAVKTHYVPFSLGAPCFISILRLIDRLPSLSSEGSLDASLPALTFIPGPGFLSPWWDPPSTLTQVGTDLHQHLNRWQPGRSHQPHALVTHVPLLAFLDLDIKQPPQPALMSSCQTTKASCLPLPNFLFFSSAP